MKNIRICAALLLAVLMLSGCSLWTVEEKLDAVEDTVEAKLDAVEDAAEAAVLRAVTPEPAAQPPAVETEPVIAAQETVPAEVPAPAPTEAPVPVPAEAPVPVSTEAPVPAPAEASPPTEAAAQKLTKEEAEAIALQHSGFSADQVNYLRTEYEIDDRVPQYDVQFHEGRWEYEYEIHAETGRILSFDKDD